MVVTREFKELVTQLACAVSERDRGGSEYQSAHRVGYLVGRIWSLVKDAEVDGNDD